MSYQNAALSPAFQQNELMNHTPCQDIKYLLLKRQKSFLTNVQKGKSDFREQNGCFGGTFCRFRQPVRPLLAAL